MIEFTAPQDYRGRQDSRIQYRDPVKIELPDDAGTEGGADHGSVP